MRRCSAAVTGPGLNVREIIHWLTAVARFEERLEEAHSAVERARRRSQALHEVDEEESASLDGLSERQEEAARQVRTCERAVRDLESRIARKREQLDQIKDNREYLALQQAITGLKEDLDREETAALEALEEAEALRVEIRTRRGELDAEHEKLAQRRQELERAAAEAEARCPDLERELAEAIAQLPPGIVAVVRRLKSGLARSTVWLEGAACGGCGAQLPQQKGIGISRGEILERCQACGRYIVARP
jgi:predicted  nucleic acid-binding Zn-ribbon protein